MNLDIPIENPEGRKNFVCDNLSVEDIKTYLSNTDIHIYAQINLILRLKEVSIDSIYPILKHGNTTCDTILLPILATQIKKLPLIEYQEYLLDNSLSYEVRKSIIDKSVIGPQDNIGSYGFDAHIINLIQTKKGELGVSPQVYSPEFEDGRWANNIPVEERKVLVENSLQGHTSRVSNLSASINISQAEKLGLNNFPVPQKRSLNLYYREGQGAHYSHFLLIAKMLKNYIENGTSSVWNDFKTVTRYGELEQLGDIKTEQHLVGNTFQSQSSVFSDTLHMSHGTPEYTKGSHSIVGEALYSDESKQEILNHISYTKLDLLYFEGSYPQTHRKIRDGSLGKGYPDLSYEEILSRVMDSVKRAEQAIILQHGLTVNQVKTDVENVLID